MPSANIDTSTRPSRYPTIVYRDSISTVPITPEILNDVVDEVHETEPDDTLSRGYLEQLVAEHQSECILDYHTLDFITHIETETNGFVAGYTDSYVYLIVNKHDVWNEEAEWMPWNDTDQYLLTTAYTREVLDIGKENRSDWVIDGLDVSTQAGYIVPVPFPLHSISQEPSIDTDPLSLAKQAETLATETSLNPTVADCLVILEATNQPLADAIKTTAEILTIGVADIDAMLADADHAQKQAHQTIESLREFETLDSIPESFYQ